MTRIAVAGDWHGNTQYARRAIEYAAQFSPDLFFHCGDLGIWPGRLGKKYRMDINDALQENSLRLIVTLGNHDDWDQVGHRLEDEEYVQWSSRISLAPRIGIVETNGLKVAHIAGAVSVDQGGRIEHESWWRQEALTEADVYKSLGFANRDVDLIISHDVPEGVTVPGLDNGRIPNFWKPYIPAAEANRSRMGEIVSTMIGDSKPILVHGHYHNRYSDKDVSIRGGGVLSAVHGLACDGDALEDNVIFLEV